MSQKDGDSKLLRYQHRDSSIDAIKHLQDQSKALADHTKGLVKGLGLDKQAQRLFALSRGSRSKSANELKQPVQSLPVMPVVTTQKRSSKKSNYKRSPKEWWATQPPGDGWHDTPLTGTKNELAKCVGVALHGKAIDVKTLATMHEKSVLICRVNRTTWQAYFRNSATFAKANAAKIDVRPATRKGAKGTKQDRKG